MKPTLGVLTILLLACGGEDYWMPVMYPDRSCLACGETYGPVVETLEMCRAYVRAQGDAVQDYECGKNCLYNPLIDMSTCDETLQ